MIRWTWRRRRPPAVTYELRYEWNPVYGWHECWIPHRRVDSPYLRTVSVPGGMVER